MKKAIRCGILATLLLFGIFADTTQPSAAQTTDELHVLFVGNSYTYFNDLPKMVAQLAKAGKQRPFRFEQETPGGYSLEKQWKDGKALAKIQARKWDFVVLQEQSQAPMTKREAMFDYGKRFDAEIKKQGAKTILYMTWAAQDKPENQKPISRAYLDLSKELKCQIAPVGISWEAALKADKNLILHNKDKSHPNATGTYLAACVFYATIYYKSPEGLPGTIGKLTDQEARPLQTIAWKAVHSIEK